MRIIQLQAENVKRLKAISIRPGTNLVEIAGKNGAGKTSTLDAIWWALASADNIQTAPIRRGEEKARIHLDLGTIRVTRTFKRKGETDFTTNLIVENEDGARFPSPQAVLDKLIGSLSFDPLAFARSKPKEQFEALRRFVPDVDFDKIDKAHKADYDARAELNRKAKEARTAADAIIVPEGTPDQAIDESALVDALESAGSHNTSIEVTRGHRANMARTIEKARAEATSLRQRAEDLRRQADELETKAASLQEAANTQEAKLAEAGPVPEPIDTSALRISIADARRINAHVDAQRRKTKLLVSAVDLEASATELTKQIQERLDAKRDAIAAAKLPVDGIGFGDGEILLNGVPFAQASDAEQLRTSIAIAIASNPKLRVIRVRDGSLLDDDAMQLLAEMADSADCQVWIETVGKGHSNAIIIEDGAVKEPEVMEAAE